MKRVYEEVEHKIYKAKNKENTILWFFIGVILVLFVTFLLTNRWAGSC